MAVEVQVDTRRLTGLIKDLEPAKIQQLLNRAGFEAEGIAKSVHKYENRSGYLTGSAHTDTSHPGEVWVGHGAGYAPYVEKWSPFLEPAVKTAIGNLVHALEHFFRKAQG